MSSLCYETEAVIFAAQEQVLATNNICKKIWKQDDSPLCRLCKKVDETVAHLISGCSPIAKKKYTPQHDFVTKYIHCCILQDYCYLVSTQWWLHKSLKTTKVSNVVDVTWDKTIIVDCAVEANLPDITIIGTDKNC
jgi:hypothetical protein